MKAPGASGRIALDAPAWDALPSAVQVLAPDGEVLHANRAFADLLGLPREAALGRAWCALLDAASCATLLQRLAGRADFALRLALRPSDEGPAWLDCAARWLEDAGHYVCVLHDGRAARRGELAARAKAEQFRLLADNVPVLIAYYEAETYRCLFANSNTRAPSAATSARSSA